MPETLEYRIGEIRKNRIRKIGQKFKLETREHDPENEGWMDREKLEKEGFRLVPMMDEKNPYKTWKEWQKVHRTCVLSSSELRWLGGRVPVSGYDLELIERGEQLKPPYPWQK